MFVGDDMPERVLGGILGGEEGRPEAEAPEALAGAEAFAAAIAHHASIQNPEVAHKTVEFLNKQSQLLEIQAEHLKDEHALRLAHLRHQLREENIRRFGLRIRVGFQLFFVLVATVIGIGGTMMFFDAVHSRSVVIDPFEVAPNIADHVPSGKIIAAGLLDVLTRIQAATRTSAERRALSNAWTNEIAINVPETGISIGQLERALKTRFGHDQHIDGDLVTTKAGGLALTVRGTRIIPKTFTDEKGDLDKLLTEAGEYAYGQSQPGLWTAYLSNNNRDDDAIRFAQEAYTTVDASERPYVLNYWANAILDKGGDGAMREALPFYREAIRLKPDYWDGYNNVMNALEWLGDEEGLVRVGEQMLKVAGGRPGRAPEEDYQNLDQALYDLLPFRASIIADMESHGGLGANSAASGSENLTAAGIDVQLHEVEAAALRLKTTPVNEKSAPDVAAAAYARARLAEEQGDFEAAARAWDAYAAAYANPTVSTNFPVGICYAAPTYEKTGQPVKADAALNAVGKLTFVDCYRFRGDVLDARRDWAGAQEWYAKSVKLAPSIPSGYYSWGMALAKRGDLDAAAAKLKDANQKGPHWADPLKAWGDVLARQGHAKEALAKYDAALKYAPNWKQLKEARQAVAKQTP
jgi:tetratricopeptide (TPR) repeat protein